MTVAVKRTILATAAITLVSCGATAQSLGELAQKTAADRANAKAASEKGADHKPSVPPRIYTNADLRSVAPGGTTPPAPAVPETKPAEPTASSSNDATPTDAASVASTDPRQDEAYWKSRLRPLWTRLDADRITLAEAMRRVDTYRAAVDATRHLVDNTVYVDRSLQERLLAAEDEMGRLTVLVNTDNKQIADIEEEARRASALPGWLRR